MNKPNDNTNCNTCAKARCCKLASQNDYPNLMSKPKRRVDVIGGCKEWAPIVRTVPLGAVVHGSL